MKDTAEITRLPQGKCRIVLTTYPWFRKPKIRTFYSPGSTMWMELQPDGHLERCGTFMESRLGNIRSGDGLLRELRASVET